MTPSEFYTAQFYTWEYRGRGWFVTDDPIHLEAPFIPYYRHGYPKTVCDDGKSHTVVSRILESLHAEKKPVAQNQYALAYETIEPFCYLERIQLKALQVKVPKERKISPEKMKALLVMLSYQCTDII